MGQFWEKQNRGQVLVFFYRHNTTMNLVKNFADSTCILPSPAGPLGCHPHNFLNMNLNLLIQIADDIVHKLKFGFARPC